MVMMLSATYNNFLATSWSSVLLELLFSHLQLFLSTLGAKLFFVKLYAHLYRGRRGRDRVVVGFTTTCTVQAVPITTNVVSTFCFSYD
jgi:uncharacterized membrane protein YccC